MPENLWTKHTVTAGTVVAGLATQAYLGLRDQAGDLIAAEGVSCLLGVPGAGILGTLVAQGGAAALTALGVNLFTARVTAETDDGLNHALAEASGAAIAGLIRSEAPKRKGLRKKAKQLEELADEVERLHSPELLETLGEELPIRPGEILEDPKGFLRRTSLSADEWEAYLRGVASEACDKLHLVGSHVRAIAEVLEERYTDALYTAVQQSAAGDGKAFAGAVLRLLNTVLTSLDAKHDDLRSTNEATWRAVRKLREELDVPRMTAAIDTLAKAASEHAEVLADIRKTVGGLHERLDQLEISIKRKIDEAADRTAKETARMTAALLRQQNLVATGARSNVLSLGKRSFHGRATELAALEEYFSDATAFALSVLHGAPGVGKSELAREYARRNAARYPGGTLAVEVGALGYTASLAEVGRRVLGLHFPDLSVDDQAMRVLSHLGGEPTLLLLDGVPDAEALRNWLPPAAAACHVLVTTNHGDWSAEDAPIEVGPLQDEDAAPIVEELTPNVDDNIRKTIVRHAAGVAMQLVPQAKAVAKAASRGRELALTIASEADASFQRPYELLDEDARVLLLTMSHLAPVSVPVAELQEQLGPALSWSADQLTAAIDACLDESLLQLRDGVSMHQLVAAWIREAEQDTETSAELTAVRRRQWERFVELAHAVGDNPADTEGITALAAYPTRPERWSDEEGDKLDAWSHRIGTALDETGRFDEALTWFERAVAAKQQGDVHGQVDHESLGASLHQVGICHSSRGRFDEALPWFERAIAAAEQGDVHGRVDHASLGTSLHQVGDCHSSRGRFEEARSCFERAVAAKQQGDVHGRVDHESLGTSLHQVGFCHASQGRFEEARPWFERAVAAAEEGDVHGRIDHAGLGRSLHEVGNCHSDSGRFDEALHWYERAVAAKHQGDVHGRVDHASLGRSLHQVGFCHASQGRFEGAQPWLQRAVAAKERGDVHGRVDHESLGVSLHEVGNCHSDSGRFDEALHWYERAVVAAEQGDVHGRVDHESLGRSLHQLGHSHASQGHFEEALPWYERAVAATAQGDVHGRVDHESLKLSHDAVDRCRRELGLGPPA